MKKEESGTRLRYGTVNLERRKHPRFKVDLPIEYSQTGILVKHGRAVNASEGGLLVCLQEKMEIGKHLVLKLFFPSGPEMNTMKTLVQVFWMDVHMEKEWADYRTGVKFVDISGGPGYVGNFFEKPYLCLTGTNLNNRLVVEKGIFTKKEFLEIVRVADKEMKKRKRRD